MGIPRSVKFVELRSGYYCRP